MTPAEMEIDVTDDSFVRALLASHDGPVSGRDLVLSSQPEISSFVSSLGSLRTSGRTE